jgi:hypothetical protein
MGIDSPCMAPRERTRLVTAGLFILRVDWDWGGEEISKKQRKVVYRRVWKEKKSDRELASSPHDTDDSSLAGCVAALSRSVAPQPAPHVNIAETPKPPFPTSLSDLVWLARTVPVQPSKSLAHSVALNLPSSSSHSPFFFSLLQPLPTLRPRHHAFRPPPHPPSCPCRRPT